MSDAMTSTARMLTAVVLVPVVTGCASIASQGIPVLAGGWTRESLRTGMFTSSCEPDDCNRTWRTSRGPLKLRTHAKTYGLHEIPGWNTQSTAGRVAGGVFGAVLRRQGMTTDYVEVGHGTRTVSDSGPTSWELRCSVYWIDDQEEEYNKSENDHVTTSARRSEGAVCRAVDLADTSVVRWRFRAGIAPPRDSLATIYDSIRIVQPELVGPHPPMTLERIAPDGTVAASYAVVTELVSLPLGMGRVAGRLNVSRAQGAPPIAVIHAIPEPALDLAADTTMEELRILRLLTALRAASFNGARD
jgi:hypothetical protein